MDTEALRARLPTVATLRKIAYSDRTRAVVDAIDEVIAEIERDDRQPTAWEFDNLLEALHLLSTGDPYHGAAQIELMLSGSATQMNGFTVPRSGRHTLYDLKQKLRSLRAVA